jgi:hypothetical protein
MFVYLSRRAAVHLCLSQESSLDELVLDRHGIILGRYCPSTPEKLDTGANLLRIR